MRAVPAFQKAQAQARLGIEGCCHHSARLPAAPSLGQRSTDREVWLWVPSGTSPNQASPWSPALALNHWRECHELHFISGLPPQGLELISGTADLIRHVPPMSARGARQLIRKTGASWPDPLLPCACRMG